MSQLKPNKPSLLVTCLVLAAMLPLHISLTASLRAEKFQQESLPRVRLGNEIFIQNFPTELEAKRLGLVINHTSILPDGRSLVKALLEKGARVGAIFSPEHGFSGTMEGGQKVVDNKLENIPIYSLYRKTRKPTKSQMQQIDAFVYDIQDVGTRFYTYITTLKYVLEAAAEAHLPVYVLDRPNPAGGIIVEGPILQPEFESFIGSLPIPIRYGLTSGELALIMKGEGWIPHEVDLHVIKMQGWKRSYFWNDTGLPWIPPSPNIPTPDAAIIFSGTGLLGGIKINQGVGTPNPFLQFGAPWLDSDLIIQSLDAETIQGISLTKLSYTPQSIPGKTTDPIYQNTLCQGLIVTIQEKDKFHPVGFCISLMKTLKLNYPQKMTSISPSLNLLYGTDHLSKYLKDSLSYEVLLDIVKRNEESFHLKRKNYLLYD